MSRTPFSRLKLFNLRKHEKIYTNEDIFDNLIFLGIVSAAHFCYAMSSQERKYITITNKYKFTRNGFTEFMVVDNNGKHYNCNNSLWYWKWDSIEEWNKIVIKKSITIKYYGWRVPIFGIFPNIVSVID
jgi:hypothetical protein